jgi:hypothetical protein
MKKIHLLFAGALLLAACQPKPQTEASAASATPDYPYKIKAPDNWVIDTNHTNTMTALKTLKAFETTDTAELKKNIGDSIVFNYDGGVFKGPASKFVAMASGMSKSMSKLKLKVTDWESVTGKTKKEEWVTVWYVQSWVDPKGKADSIELVNDLQFKGGKIVQIDEYGRRFTPLTK